MTVLDWEQPDASSPIYGNRLDTYKIERLNLDHEVEEELTWSSGSEVGVLPGGTIDRSIYTEVREQCRLPIVRDRSADADWVHSRVRISYVGAGLAEPEPIGTFIPTASPETHPATHVVESLELHGALRVLLSKIGTTFGVGQGENVTDWIHEVIGQTGYQFFSVTPSNKEMAASKVWDPSTTRLRIVNDLAAAIGYWSAHTDEEGTIIVDPKTALDARPLTWVFDDGPETGLYLPDWGRDKDLLVPNKVTVIQRVEGIWDPLKISAELPSEHPQSFENRGYWEERVEVDVDFTDEESGYIRALTFLGDGIPTESRSFTHLWVPGVGLNLNSKVMHRRSGLPDLIGPVKTQTFRIATGGLVETKISGTEVVEGEEEV